MSTPEERLAALLRDTDIPVRGDGLQRIQAKLARRRRMRWVAPVAALATAGAAASVIVLAGGGDRDTLTVQPGGTPAASADPTPTPVPCGAHPPLGAPCPTGSMAPSSQADGQYDGPFVYPDLGPSASPDSLPWANDPAQVAQHFVTDFLKLDGITVSTEGFDGIPGPGRDVRLLAGKTDVSLLHLESIQGGSRWVVTQANGTGAQITAPGFGAAVTSPLEVSGTLDRAVDDNVRLTLVTSYGMSLAETSAPAGSDVPWRGTLTWARTQWSRGAVVGVTRSNKDGAVTRVIVQPVVRATGAEVATFVGIVDGHVSTFATDGSLGRQLTYPPAGSRDVDAGFNGSSALVVRTDPGTCRQRLIRLDGTTAHNVVEPGTASLATPRLSPDGTWEAWVTTSCAGGASSVALREGDKPVRLLTVPGGTSVAVDGVRDDGSLLVRVGTTGSYGERLLSPSAGSVTGGKALAPRSGCQLGAPAFDGPRIAAWEECSGKVHLVRYDGNGVRVSVDPDVPVSDAPTRTSVNSGRVLVWLFGGDTVGEVARYQDGKLTTVVRNTGCTSVSEPKGCVREPSW
jgi:hypothetical protein